MSNIQSIEIVGVQNVYYLCETEYNFNFYISQSINVKKKMFNWIPQTMITILQL